MLIRALEAKDRYTSGDSERVAEYAAYIGEELNFMPARLERLRFAALMHDIGKLVVPNQLLNKPGRLTPEEFAPDRRRFGQRPHALRSRRSRPPDRAVHRDDRRRVRRHDLHTRLPEGAVPGRRV